MGDIDIDLDNDGSIGLGEEDRNKVNSSRLDWYKGEKGRTDRVAVVYFNSLDKVALAAALKENPKLSKDKQIAEVMRVRAELGEKFKKSPDELNSVDLLDLSEARFRPVRGSFLKTPVNQLTAGYYSWPRGSMSVEEEKLWSKTGEPRDYVCTVLIWYPTDREGELDKNNLAKGWKVLPWKFAPERYLDIRKIHRGLAENGSSVSAYDLNISCVDTQYQKITILPAGPAIYLKNEQFKRKVLEKAVSLYTKLNPFKEMTTDELREKLGKGSAGGGGVAPGSDYSDQDVTNYLENV